MKIWAIALLSMLACGAADAKTVVPNSYREIYDVSLERTSGYLLTARGRTVVETHAGCGVMHTLQRSLADTTYKDGQPIRTDFTIETWESVDGRTLRFRTRNWQSGNGTETHAGIAKLNADGSGQVTYTTKDTSFPLPRGTMFPNAFSHAMLDAALKDRDLDNHVVFQGGGRSALVTAAAKIGRKLSSAKEETTNPAGLLRGAVWPILISYFSQDGELPASEVAAHLYANGLLGSLSLVYPQFTLRAKLIRVARLPSSC